MLVSLLQGKRDLINSSKIDTCIYSLNKEIKDEDLHSSVCHLFENWGPLLSVKVFKDWLKRPYAFVQYEVRIFVHLFNMTF
jgi:hypothetical protein